MGNVMFLTKDNLSASAMIDKEGNYRLEDAPVGDVRISVSVPKISPAQLEAMKRMSSSPAAQATKSVDPNNPSRQMVVAQPPDTIVQIPDKYADPATSGLTTTIKSGEQTYDIPLSP